MAVRNKEDSLLTSRPSGASAKSDRLVAMERPAEESASVRDDEGKFRLLAEV